MFTSTKHKMIFGGVALAALLGIFFLIKGHRTYQAEHPNGDEVVQSEAPNPGEPSTPGTPDLAQPGAPGGDGVVAPGAEPGGAGSVAGGSVAGGADGQGGVVAGSDGGDVAVSNADGLTAEEIRRNHEANGLPTDAKPLERVHTLPNGQQVMTMGAGKQVSAGKTGEASVGMEMSGGTTALQGGQQVAMLTPGQSQGSNQGKAVQQNGKPGAQQPGPNYPGAPLLVPGAPSEPVADSRVKFVGPLAPKGSQVATQNLEPKPEPPKDGCYSVTYHHRHAKLGTGDETCSHHKNLVKIVPAEGLRLNAKTVCIRVNGTPVKFSAVKGKAGEFVIGTVVGMDTAVTARYCTGHFRCTEDCKVPRDEFVEAIGGSDMDTDEATKLTIAVWDKEDPNDTAANQKLQADMKKGLSDLDEVAKAAAQGYTLFQDWKPEAPVQTCQLHKAVGPEPQETRKVASKR